MNAVTKAAAGLALISYVLSAGASSGQDSAPGPLFSTPASRSTIGTPVLEKPESQSNGDINSRRPKPAKAAPAQTAAQPKQAAAEPPRSDMSVSRTGVWELQCTQLTPQQKKCQASSSVISPDGKSIVLVTSLAVAADGKQIAAQIAVPLGIALSPGVKFDLDGYTTTLPLSRCTPQGCLVEGMVPDKLVATMKEKPEATVSVATPDGKEIAIKQSLDGFTKTFDEMLRSESAR